MSFISHDLKGGPRFWSTLFMSFSLLSVSVFSVGCGKDAPPEEEPLPVHDYPSDAVHWKAGEVRYGLENWTEVVVGDMPLVISVPHGGNVRPEGVPDRTCPDVTTVRDLNTIELARAISEEFLKTYGKRPYLVINHLARVKVDQNRDIQDATCGNPLMKQAWEDYHHFTDSAVSTAATRHGHAIFIDLHGHGHAVQRLELGYSLTGQELTQLFGGLNVEALGAKSSVANWLRMRSEWTLRDVLTGDQAFGTLMAAGGFPSIPSRDDPYPYAGEAYFNGGYNTRYYTSASYPDVYGWQIECNNQGVRDNAGNRARFAQVFARVIEEIQ